MTSILTIIQQQDEEYDRLHALYEEAKQRVEHATTPEELEAATTAFHPIQQEFLRNRERATPTECYQIIASFLDRESRARLAQCDKHLHYQVIYGKYSGVFVWSVGGLLEQVYRRTYKKDPKTPTMTPLLHASREGTSLVVRVLIDAKADLEAIDDDWNRRTALHWACWEGHEEVVGLLIDAGTNVNVIARGLSPLFFAVEANSLPIVRRLLTAGANPTGGIGLHKAAKLNNGEMVNVLLEAKADVNYADARGWTALHSAARNNSMSVIPILIAAGANINERNNDGNTPLIWACMENNTDAAITLLTANADPNIVDNNGWSPLMSASEQGNVDVVRALLAANANVHTVNNRGNTALKLAKRYNHDEVVALLLAAGAVDE